MRKVIPDGPRRSNCYVWARWRQWMRGGYIASRMSRHSRWKRHYVWSKDLKCWWGYTPRSPRNGWRALLHGPWFQGRIEREER